MAFPTAVTANASFFWIIVLVLVGVQQSVTVTVGEGGGYRELVIAVSPHIDYKQAEDALYKLKVALTRTSLLLHTSTRKQSYFEEIIFLLPRNSRYVPSKSTDTIAAGKGIHRSDITLVPKGLFQSEPYTIQHAGCGQSGLRVYLPLDFLDKPNLDMKAKALVHEWAHYRYGVFDEHGFQHDDLYPLVHSIPGKNGSFSVTGCTDKNPTYKFVNITGQACEDFFSDDCYPTAADDRNANIASSLMQKPFFPTMNQFCDKNNFPHNQNAPTKQNSLCRERSTWDVILQHDDFKKSTRNTENHAMPNDPQFKYVIEQNPQFVLAVESTDNMALNDRMNSVRNAFSYFLLNDVPKDSKIGLTDLKMDSPLPSLIDFVSENSAQRVLDLFPEAYGKSSVCVHCGILRGIKALTAGDGSGCITLVTTEDILVDQIQNISSAVTESRAKLFVVFFQTSETAVPLLETLAVKSGGKFFKILENSYNSERLSSLTILYEIFRLIHESFYLIHRDTVLIEHKVFLADSSEGFLTFEVDDTIENMKVILTGPNFTPSPPIVKNTLFLQSEEKMYRVGDPGFSYRMMIPAYEFSVDNPQVGTWNLTFERKSGNHSPLVAIIRGGCSSNSEILNAHAWITSYPINGKQTFIMYAEVLRGIYPMPGAKVTAFLHHHATGNSTELELFDSGEGDPDITRQDGIYTRYLTGLKLTGYYTASVRVHRNKDTEMDLQYGMRRQCCGSVILADQEIQSQNFTRTILLGSVYIGKEFFGDFPPRRIVDLHVTDFKVSHEGLNLYTLQWTAPGDDYDSGIVAEYEIKIFETRQEALNDFDEGYLLVIDYTRIYGPLIQPKPSGSVQTLIVELKNLTTGIYFLAIRTIDSVGNTADVSNVVQFYYTQPDIQPDITATSSMTTTDVETISPKTDETETQWGLSSVDLSLIIGLTLVALFIFLISGILLLIYFRKHRKQKRETSADISQPNYNERNANANTTVYVGSVSAAANQKSIGLAGDSENQYASSDRTCHNMTTFKRSSDDISIVSRSNPQIYNIDNAAYDNDSLYAVPLPHQQHYDMNNTPFNPSYASSLRRSHDNQPRLATDV